MRPELTRREFVQKSVVVSGALFADFARLGWPRPTEQKRTRFPGGKQVGTVEFVNEGQPPMGVAFGTELDGRLYTDLLKLNSENLVTPTRQFYIRTRASQILPELKSWKVQVEGLVERTFHLTVEDLKQAAKPVGLHLMECAGNVPLVCFGMISVANWSGVLLSEILDSAGVKGGAARVLISGYDRYANESRSSIPGASWIFPMEDLSGAGAFLATGMNELPLTRDHGAPVRLVVPGWYGCTCIKWVNNITVVEDSAEATSQMQEYAARTLQNGIPQLARDYQRAVIEQAAMPIRVEKWLVEGKIKYRVIGISWGGSRPIRTLFIRFNPEEEYVPVDNFEELQKGFWTIWSHAWSPKEPGIYLIRLSVRDPNVRARRLDSGYYVRSVEITEV